MSQLVVPADFALTIEHDHECDGLIRVECRPFRLSWETGALQAQYLIVLCTKCGVVPIEQAVEKPGDAELDQIANMLDAFSDRSTINPTALSIAVKRLRRRATR